MQEVRKLPAGGFQAWCSCGWVSRPSGRHGRATHALHNHLAREHPDEVRAKTLLGVEVKKKPKPRYEDAIWHRAPGHYGAKEGG